MSDSQGDHRRQRAEGVPEPAKPAEAAEKPKKPAKKKEADKK